MKRELIFSALFLCVALALISLVPAPNNGSGNNNPTTINCTNDDDCPNNKECKNDICTLKEDDDDEDEVNETEIEDDEKVCCLRIITKGDESYEKYNYIEKDDCLAFTKESTTSGVKKVGDIVGDSLCEKRHMNETETKEQARERQRMRFEEKTGIECPNDCVCTGVVMKCILEDGSREMKVYARNSGNLIIQVKDTNASVTVTLYKDDNGTLYAFKDGKERKVNILPDEAKEKMKEKMKDKVCDCENITLTEDMKYEVQTQKGSRLFWIFPVREKFRLQVDAEDGKVKLRNPWWGFLANDKSE